MNICWLQIHLPEMGPVEQKEEAQNGAEKTQNRTENTIF